MIFDLELYSSSIKELEGYHQKENEIDTNYRKKQDDIRKKYWDLERDLSSKKYAEENRAEKKHKAELAQIKKKKEKSNNNTQEFKRILDFLHIKNTKTHDLNNFNVYYYDYPKRKDGSSDYAEKRQQFNYEPISVLEDKEMLKIEVFITKNRKPKNKYSLIAAGKSFFNDEVVKLPYNYGIDTHNNNANIFNGIKDFPTQEEAKEYFERNKDKILKIFREEHAKVEDEYKQILDNTNTTKWHIAYLESRMHYYETCYSNGTEEEEYKQIVKEVKRLRRKNESRD